MLQNRNPVNTSPYYAFGFLPVDPPVDKQKPSRCSSWLLASLTTGGLDTMQAALATCELSRLCTMQKSTYQTLWSWSTVCKLNMADPSEKELAAVFDLLKISLSKTDPTVDKSNALKGLVVAAVGRAEAAGELKGSNPNQIATDVCITLRYLTGGLLASGEQRSNTGLTVRPYVSVTKKYSRDALSADMVGDVTSGQLATDSAQSGPAHSSSHVSSAGVVGVDRSASSVPDQNRLQIVNFALRELGSATIKSKSDVAKMKAGDIKLLAEYLQQHLDHDPQTGEPLSFDKDFVMVDGAYPYSKSGNPTAADIKQGLRAFLAG